MHDIPYYNQRLSEIAGAPWEGRKKDKLHLQIEYDDNDLASMKNTLADIRNRQKQLRFLKKEANQDMKEIRQIYKLKVAEVQPTFLSILSGKGKRDSVAKQKRKINAEKDGILRPYDQVKLVIDNLLTNLDSGKLQIDRQMQELKSR